MSVSIADFFVSLGVKGADKTKREVKDVKGSIEGVKDMSLQAKAAIVGMVFGLQQMVGSAARMGTELGKFSDYTGLSAQALQKYQYAAKLVGVANEEVEGSLKAIQDRMTQTRLFGEAPKGLGLLADAVDIDFDRIDDTFYMFNKIQEFLRKAPIAAGNQVAQSFGLTEGVIAAMRKGAFNPAAMAKADLYSQKEIQNLRAMDVELGLIGEKISKAYGHFFAQAGGTELIKGISGMVDGVTKFSEALIKLDQASGVLQGISAIFKTIGYSAELTATAIEKIVKLTGDVKPGEVERVKSQKAEQRRVIEKFAPTESNVLKQFFNDMFMGASKMPFIEYGKSKGRNPSSTSVSVNQSFEFYGPPQDNMREVYSSFEKGIIEAFRQDPQMQEN